MSDGTSLQHLVPSWVEPDPLKGRAVDALGLQATADQIAEQLLPGLSVLTNRARYFSLLAWARQACGRLHDEHRIHRLEVALAVREAMLHTGSADGADRAGYHAHPSRNLAGAGERRWLDRLPCSCSKWRMRVPSVSRIRTCVLAPMERLWSQLAPRKQASEIAGVVVDMVRPRRELVLENAVLRHQVNVLQRRSKRPKLHFVDRLKLLLGARWLPSWRRAIALVQPETVLRWHRAGFRRFWRRRSRPRKTSPLPPETINLIRDMAARGRLWGAERIRGELLKLGIKVSKRTVQKYMRGVRGKSSGGQRWATFVKNHAERMWACDFIQTHDLLFRQVYAFFIVHLASRRVVHVAATRHPTQAWTAQQLRNATMDGDAPAVLLRDRDDKFGPEFDRAARGVGTKVIRTAVRAPNMNAVAERFVGSARRELLDHVLLINEQHLADLLRQYQRYFNESRPHQGIEQRVPAGSLMVTDSSKPVAVTSVLGGLHVDYRRAA